MNIRETAKCYVWRITDLVPSADGQSEVEFTVDVFVKKTEWLKCARQYEMGGATPFTPWGDIDVGTLLFSRLVPYRCTIV